jgi:hypothetical protein
MPLQNLQTHNITFFSYFITYFVLIVYVTLSKFKGDLALTTEGYRCIAYFNDKHSFKICGLIWYMFISPWYVLILPSYAVLNICWTIMTVKCKCPLGDLIWKIKLFCSILFKWGHRNVLSIFHIINFKKNKIMDTGVLEFVNKKLILDYYFCLMFGPVFLFQIFTIAPLFLPRDIQLYH